MKTSNHIDPILPINGVEIGKEIGFERRGKTIHGKVVHIKEVSIIVQLQQEDIDFLGLENELTVVNHKNYIIK